MIVADASVIFPFVFEMETSGLARQLHAQDSNWRYPPLWRQEFSSALLKYVRAGRCEPGLANQTFEKALRFFGGHEAEVDDRLALGLALDLGLSAYDAQYVALGQQLGAVLVTADKALARRCGGRAVMVDEFGRK
ncbi:MAG TPA: type II toxin-antitoxin system VapC family toxin [bacterium]|jgi:predicted nucleic acid-binding protein|nr:type II toxin-antitoxin system VapC family toxin [bacterium]HXC64765.1 type II toxin-antitoxin system VapC family toxin [bacterium]